jgi:hypothetical protein
VGLELQGPTLSLMSILGTRMFLHIRENVEEIYYPERNLRSLEFVVGKVPEDSNENYGGRDVEIFSDFLD